MRVVVMDGDGGNNWSEELLDLLCCGFCVVMFLLKIYFGWDLLFYVVDLFV